MHKDTRDRNQYFNTTEVFRYLREYAGSIQYGLLKIPEEEIEKAKELLKLTLVKNGRIFVGGNGGSHVIADHLCCDFMKGTFHSNKNNLIVHNLGASPALLTATGNDLGYDQTLSFPMKLYNANASDILILVSSSGNSSNIIRCGELAKSCGISVIGLSGFDGGWLARNADISLHIPINNYGVIEDCHQALMHVLAQYHYLEMKND